MGNYRFRLSDMMPNAWFYKLKDMSKPKIHGNTITKKKQHSSSSSSTTTTQPSKTKQQPHNKFYPRKSYYFTRELIPSDKFHVPQANTKSPLLDPPRKSSKKRSKKRNINSSVTAGCRFRAKADSSSSEDDSSSPQEHRFDCILTTQSLDNMVSLSKPKDVLIHDDDDDDVNKSFDKKSDKLGDFDNLSEYQLPRIITKTVKFNYTEKGIKKKPSPGRKSSVNSPGVRLRMNSPKIGSRRIQGYASKGMSSSSSSSSKKSLSDSFAVVKSSFDPQRDFKESMVEMIMENNIRASKDLEDLLACYLSLNSNEYHHLIIKVFKQIWFDLNDVRLK